MPRAASGYHYVSVARIEKDPVPILEQYVHPLRVVSRLVVDERIGTHLPCLHLLRDVQ